jgi:uncharacterized protein YegL
MWIKAYDVIGGFNAFLEEHKSADGEAWITVVQFDNRYELNYNLAKIEDVQPLCGDTYIPRGSTALLDAIGKTIVDVGSQLKGMPEETRPSKVLVTVFTDGAENASQEFTQRAIKDMIKHQEEKYAWDFAFLGADQGAILMAKDIGFRPGNVLHFDDSSAGVQDVMHTYTTASRAYRGVGIQPQGLFGSSES